MFARSGVVTSEWCEHLGVRGAERDELAKKQVQDAVKGEGRSDLNEAELILKSTSDEYKGVVWVRAETCDLIYVSFPNSASFCLYSAMRDSCSPSQHMSRKAGHCAMWSVILVLLINLVITMHGVQYP